MRVAMALCAAGLLAGCASGLPRAATGLGWARPGAGVQQVTLDEIECLRVAAAAGRTRDLVLGGFLDVARLAVESGEERRALERCLSGRGYRQAAAESERTHGGTSRS